MRTSAAPSCATRSPGPGGPACDLLRVNCWAGAPGLVALYERQGFTKTSTFAVKDWHGQVFAMDL